ncbi:hypothetical protein [Flavobacterium ginsengiterrae]
MDLLRYIKSYVFAFFLLLLLSCDKYEEDEQIYQLIIIENWKIKEIPTIKLYHFEKESNFSKRISIDSLFEVTYDSVKKYLTIIPQFDNNKPIHDDMILLLNDNLEYRFTDVCFIKDTLKKPLLIGTKFTIRYNLRAKVNKKEINYLDSIKYPHQSSYISLDKSLAKKINSLKY